MVFKFEATLSLDGWMGALLIPETIAHKLAQHKVKRVVATVKKDATQVILYAGIIKQKGVVYLMFSKANQKLLGTQAGDMLQIEMKEDNSKYQAPMTEELEAVLLSDYDAFQIFEGLLPGKQRNIIFMVYGVKDSQKRIDIALNAMENLKLGNINPMRFEKLI